MKYRLRPIFALCSAFGVSMIGPGALFAQTPPPVSAATQQDIIDARASDLLKFFGGEGTAASIFHESFLKAVPESKLKEIIDGMRGQYGKPISVQRIERHNAQQASIFIEYDKAVAQLDTTLGSADDNSLITGLYISNIEVKGDGVETVIKDLKALPGRTSLGVWKLGADGLKPVTTYNTDVPMAVGSSFKLAILGALDADIKAGKRRWSDVVPLTHKSLPSGQTQNWPNRAPMTLHSLATLMISISDNSATDTLLHHIGRARVDAFLKTNAIVAQPRYPTLSTLQAFILKEPEQASLQRQWAQGNYAERAALLDGNVKVWTLSNSKGAMMAGKPIAIDSVEWFYSGEEMARLLAWFAQKASPDAKAIMAVSPGVAPTQRASWRYIGYKGGSETGVIAMNYLLTTQKGETYVVASAWNDPKAPVADDTYFLLINRVTAMLAKR